jgi:hypothetical protein
MKPILKFLLPVFAFSLSPLAFAQGTNYTINFEQLPEWSSVTNQYDTAQYGNVTFSDALQLNACDFDCFDYPAHSGTGEITNTANAITIAFSNTLNSIRGWYSAPDGIVLTVYNSLGTAIFTQAYGGTTQSSALFSYTGGGGKWITITANDGGLNETVDDLAYNVPEYGSSAMWLLMSLGAMTLGLAFRTRAA